MVDLDDTNTIYVKEEEEGLRIDKLLSMRYDQKSRTYFQYLIENECVLLNGKKIKKRITPKKGDEIEIFFILTKEISLEPQDIKLNIIYEDSDVIAINKPPNMVVHPAPGNWKDTFVNALLYHCKNISTDQDNLRPGIVHRLDKDTSGILLAAKNKDAHRKLIEQFSSREIKKEYLAVCFGSPINQLIDSPIGRHKTRRKEMTVKTDGKKAITEIENLYQKDGISIILAKPKTGRTHQIRIHLKHVSSPIIGDETYGSYKINKKFNAKRQMLHAFKIKFMHPTKNISIELTAPLPLDFQEFSYLFDKIKI